MNILNICIVCAFLLLKTASGESETALTDDDFAALDDSDYNESEDEETALTDEDFKDLDNYEEEEQSEEALDGGLFEGDIDLDGKPLDYYIAPKNVASAAIRDERYRWPNAVVPYTLSSTFNRKERRTIAAAFRDFHRETCVRLVARSGQKSYVFIARRSGCYSSVGRTGGRQILSLGNNCVYKGIVIHELMHALGFWHEQSRADRDDFVTIVRANIRSGTESNFKKYSLSYITHLGMDYDYKSVMHYSAGAFAKRKNMKTIIPKFTSPDTIGQRKGFSPNDIEKVKRLYKCKAPTTTTKKPTVSVDDCTVGLRLWRHVDVWKISELAACKAACARSEECTAVTFVPAWAEAPGACVTFDDKRKKYTRTQEDGFTTCFVNKAPLGGDCKPGVRLWNHIDVWAEEDIESCKQACRAASHKCQAITFVPAWKYKCITFDNRRSKYRQTHEDGFTTCYL